MKAPQSKLKAFTEAYRLVVNSIEIFSKKKDGVGAEDSMPIFVYLFSQSELKQLPSTLKYKLLPCSYIDMYGTCMNKMRELDEYCYIAIKGVVIHFKTYKSYIYYNV